MEREIQRYRDEPKWVCGSVHIPIQFEIRNLTIPNFTVVWVIFQGLACPSHVFHTHRHHSTSPTSLTQHSASHPTCWSLDLVHLSLSPLSLVMGRCLSSLYLHAYLPTTAILWIGMSLSRMCSPIAWGISIYQVASRRQCPTKGDPQLIQITVLCFEECQIFAPNFIKITCSGWQSHAQFIRARRYMKWGAIYPSTVMYWISDRAQGWTEFHLSPLDRSELPRKTQLLPFSLRFKGILTS